MRRSEMVCRFSADLVLWDTGRDRPRDDFADRFGSWVMPAVSTRLVELSTLVEGATSIDELDRRVTNTGVSIGELFDAWQLLRCFADGIADARTGDFWSHDRESRYGADAPSLWSTMYDLGWMVREDGWRIADLFDTDRGES